MQPPVSPPEFDDTQKLEFQLAYWIGHNGEIERAAARSLEGWTWKLLTEAQRELVNLLYARRLIDIKKGKVVLVP